MSAPDWADETISDAEFRRGASWWRRSYDPAEFADALTVALVAEQLPAGGVPLALDAAVPGKDDLDEDRGLT